MAVGTEEEVREVYGREHLEIFAALAAPFAHDEVKVRAQGGRQLHYVTARTVMNRLDDVVGPANWWDSYVPGEHSVLCHLSVRLPSGEVIVKADAGGYAGMADQGDDDKSGYSDAFKRAAVKFGVSRYLYRDGVPAFVRENAPGPEMEPQAHNPAEARQDGRSAFRDGAGANPPAQRRDGQGGAQGGRGEPRSGKALFAWTKEQEEQHQVGLLKFLNQWAKLQDFPYKMVEWDEEQVRLALAEAKRKLQNVLSSEPADGDVLAY